MKDKDTQSLKETYQQIINEYAGTYGGTIIFPSSKKAFDVSVKVLHDTENNSPIAEYFTKVNNEIISSQDIYELAEIIKEKFNLGQYNIKQ